MRRLTDFWSVLIAVALVAGPIQAATHKLNKDEEKLFKIIKSNKLQQRPEMTLDPILCKVARARAADLGKRKYFDHTNPDGAGPNFLVTKAGYQLPDFYSKARDANNIESIAARSPKGVARDGLKQWIGSPPHREHTMGLSDFARDQTRIGVGVVHFANAPFATYYVFISAPPNENPRPPRVTLKNAKGRIIATTR